jgi:hypothetical protein
MCGVASPTAEASNQKALEFFIGLLFVGAVVWGVSRFFNSDDETPERSVTVAPVVNASPGWNGPDPEPLPVAAPADPGVMLTTFEQRVMKLLLVDDLTKFANGGKGSFGYAEASSGVLVAASADELQRSFESNEVAGGQAYGGKTVFLRGRVDSISRDIENTPFISFVGGSNMFMKPIATMAGDHTDYLAGLKKGQSVTLACDSARMVMTSATVSNCLPLASWLSAIVDATLTRVPDALRGSYVNNLTRLAVTAVAITIVTPENSPCWSKQACLREIGAQIKRPHVPKLVAERLRLRESDVKNILS